MFDGVHLEILEPLQHFDALVFVEAGFRLGVILDDDMRNGGGEFLEFLTVGFGGRHGTPFLSAHYRHIHQGGWLPMERL